jgi:hypothetical protein
MAEKSEIKLVNKRVKKPLPDGMVTINQPVNKGAYQRLKIHAVEKGVNVMDVVDDAINFYAGYIATGKIKAGSPIKSK